MIAKSRKFEAEERRGEEGVAERERERDVNRLGQADRAVEEM